MSISVLTAGLWLWLKLYIIAFVLSTSYRFTPFQTYFYHKDKRELYGNLQSRTIRNRAAVACCWQPASTVTRDIRDPQGHMTIYLLTSKTITFLLNLRSDEWRGCSFCMSTYFTIINRGLPYSHSAPDYFSAIALNTVCLTTLTHPLLCLTLFQSFKVLSLSQNTCDPG
jgi:hypothetical protein